MNFRCTILIDYRKIALLQTKFLCTHQSICFQHYSKICVAGNARVTGQVWKTGNGSISSKRSCCLVYYLRFGVLRVLTVPLFLVEPEQRRSCCCVFQKRAFIYYGFITKHPHENVPTLLHRVRAAENSIRWKWVTVDGLSNW